MAYYCIFNHFLKMCGKIDTMTKLTKVSYCHVSSIEKQHSLAHTHRHTHTHGQQQHSQQGGETACFGWSLLSSPDTPDFCAASVGTCAGGDSPWGVVRKGDIREADRAKEHNFVRTHCEHSAVFPLLWKSIIHWMSWLFSSSNCTYLHHVLI